MDEPNVRSSHRMPTPRGGGVSFVVVYIVLLCALFYWGPDQLRPSAGLLTVLLFGGGSVALIGFVDDHRHVPIRWRFLVHAMAAMLAVYLLGAPLYMDGAFGFWIGKILASLAVFAIVWNLNLFNFMDGIDGIASIEAITTTCGAALILYLLGSAEAEIFWLLALAAGVAGFLGWNWPPARIFMGDSASGFLGFSIPVLALYSAWHGEISLWSWLILLGVFLTDATWTLIRRMFSGQRWYKAHASHAYQILARQRIDSANRPGVDSDQARARGHRWVTLWVAAINIFWLFPLALGASLYPQWGPLIASGAILPLVIIEGYSGAGREDR